MIGIFLVNQSGQICLTRYDAANQPDITGVVYLPASRIAALSYADGSEEVVVDETNDSVHTALIENTQLLVVNLDDASKPQREYTVDIRK